jgi:hypothetical protein
LRLGIGAPSQVLEDDTAILASKLDWTPQEYVSGNSIDTSTTLQLVGTANGITTANATGTVTHAGVADFFRFYAAAGSASFTGQVGGASACDCVLLQTTTAGVFGLYQHFK